MAEIPPAAAQAQRRPYHVAEWVVLALALAQVAIYGLIFLLILGVLVGVVWLAL